MVYFLAQKKPKAKTYGGLRPGTRQNQTKQPPKSAQSDKTVKQMLGELYGDKMYLEKLTEAKENKTKSESIFVFYSPLSQPL